MKNYPALIAPIFRLHSKSRIPVLAAIVWAMSLSVAQAESHDFNSGHDAGWSHYDPLAGFGVPGVFSFPGGGYRIRTTSPSPDPENLGNARTGSLLGTPYSGFYVAVDLVDWNDALPQAIGILARVSTRALAPPRATPSPGRGAWPPMTPCWTSPRSRAKSPTTCPPPGMTKSTSCLGASTGSSSSASLELTGQ